LPPTGGPVHHDDASTVQRSLGAICGPLIGGWLLGAGVAYPWGFYVFAAVAAIGALAVSLAAHPPEDDHHGIVEDQYLGRPGTAESNILLFGGKRALCA
jgi:MFS family permease